MIRQTNNFFDIKYYNGNICDKYVVLICGTIMAKRRRRRRRKRIGKFLWLIACMLDVEASRQISEDCEEMMGLISELYKNADKGYASNVVIADEVIDQMVEKLKSAGYPITVTAAYSNMENYKALEDFLSAAIKGSSGSSVVYEIHSDGGIGRYKYSYDGKDMYVLSAKAARSDDDKPVLCSDWDADHAEDGRFQYLGNKILDDGISNIPQY